MATHSSVLAWRIPGTGEPGGLPSVGSQMSGFDGSKPRKVLIKRAQWEALFGDGSYVPDGDEAASGEAMDDEAPWDSEDEEKA